jgi:hypothetical protein
MDPVSLATSAAALLATYLGRAADRAASDLADTLGEAAVTKLGQLYRWLRTKVTGKPAVEEALQRLEEEPQDDERQIVLRVTLTDLIRSESESGFAETLERLVAEAQQAGGPALTQIVDAGIVAGRDVHLRGRNVAGRDLTIGQPPAKDGEA